MADGEPKWRRRKTARPNEIIAAALEGFAETGCAAARLDEIARRAGVSRGALNWYFETKEALFRAVARTAVAADLAAVEQAAGTFDGPLAKLIPMLLSRAAAMLLSRAAAMLHGSRVPSHRTRHDGARMHRPISEPPSRLT